MKCPVCQRDVESVDGTVKSICDVDFEDHIYLHNPEGGYLVESYMYGGYRIHASPKHPTMQVPLTSVYLPEAYDPLYQESVYLSFPEIQQVIKDLNQARKDLN